MAVNLTTQNDAGHSKVEEVLAIRASRTAFGILIIRLTCATPFLTEHIVQAHSHRRYQMLEAFILKPQACTCPCSVSPALSIVCTSLLYPRIASQSTLTSNTPGRVQTLKRITTQLMLSLLPLWNASSVSFFAAFSASGISLISAIASCGYDQWNRA